MKKLMRMIAVGMLSGSVCLSAAPAYAQTVTVDGPAAVLHVAASAEDGAQTQEMELQSFELFGLAGEDQVLIRADEAVSAVVGDAGAPAEDAAAADGTADAMTGEVPADAAAGDAAAAGTEETEAAASGGFLYVSREELESTLPELDCSALPQMEDMVPAGPGTIGEEVVMLQETLTGLGLLTGAADGDYGAGTAAAVSAFQTARGLEATGSADVYTMLLITAIHDGLEESVTAAAGGYDTPEEKFPQIAANTDADLSIYMDNLWHFHFDSFEDAGTIDPGVELGSFEVLLPEIDRIRGTASLKVQVSKDEVTGMYTAVPAIVTETAGAYRPYMQGAWLTGGANVKLDGGSSTGSIDGATLMETGCIPLTEEVITLLKEGGVTGIRLIGKNSEYDLSLNIDADRLAAAMQAF